jgi:hypothetical protein
VSAQDVRPGIASIAVVTAEPEGRYGMDGGVLKPAKLKRNLVALDEQMAIGHLHLRKGTAEITPAQLAEMREIAGAIGARLMVEKDGRMEPDTAPQAPAGG